MKFFKYQGTGNDFIIINNIKNNANFYKKEIIKKLCDRRFGIGADGFMAIENSQEYDFKMRYFNSDGSESSMCGNGGRCIVSFANFLGLIKEKTIFEAVGQEYHAQILNGELISLRMIDLKDILIENKNQCFLDTGSPHHVEFVDNVDDIDVFNKGKEIRYSEKYHKIGGTNVNFTEKIGENIFKIRTYERGVEDETFSCGTGSVAVAISAYEMKKTDINSINIVTKGGDLKVEFEKIENIYTNIRLIGLAQQVFTGEINL